MGLMALTSDVQLVSLQDSFELEPYDNLVRVIPNGQTVQDVPSLESAPTDRSRGAGSEENAQASSQRSANSRKDSGAALEGVIEEGEEEEDDIARTLDLEEDNRGYLEEDIVSNAFAVTLFCMDEAYESRAADFLPHAFAMFRDSEYCILTLPHVSTDLAISTL